ncbi:six-bladed beta-propeller -like protein [Ophiostoma piceae UAMH 11346]|uniref:Six-bladed beta-propeller-like protein n=1 Tax=Ophiostoma piceae (strain UAMH 11346) TaxID=1262450 RepID=S3CXE5_OPHP1|nr:six-bladed beta-propeller -like protein [Ophiostoma piceae UAMH 11346]
MASAGTAAAASASCRQSQSAATQVAEMASVENLTIRSNGLILATNMNSPDLCCINATAKASSTAVIVTDALGLSGIGEVSPDVFAVIGGGKRQSTSNGLAVFDNDTVIAAGAGKGNVYRFSVSTGDYSVVLSDPTMAPSGDIPLGIDGIKYRDGTVWYTNIFNNSFHKISVDNVTAEANGPVTTLWTNLRGDDLCFGPNGKLYVATNGNNSVVEVDPTVGKYQVTAVTGSTSCAFGRTDTDSDVMYVGGNSGVYSQAIKD